MKVNDEKCLRTKAASVSLLASVSRSVQSLSRVWFFATPWITARQASLSITNSWSSLKLMSIESVMPSSHLIFCRPLLLLPPIPPSIWVFSNDSALRIVLELHCIVFTVLYCIVFTVLYCIVFTSLYSLYWQSIGASVLASFLPKNTQDWSPLGWTDWISLQSKGLSRVLSNTTVQKHQFLGSQLSS